MNDTFGDPFKMGSSIYQNYNKESSLALVNDFMKKTEQKDSSLNG